MYHIEKGNNSKLVHSLLSKRWWWAEVLNETDQADINL